MDKNFEDYWILDKKYSKTGFRRLVLVTQETNYYDELDE